ncbi:MAG: S46 family peptidase [Bacteroidota bacterium]
MKKRMIVLFFCFLSAMGTKADEGMWLPILLEQLNQGDMQSIGLKLTSEEIYSINHSSLKDAVCLFGGGCTAEVVSDQGMILTNHHCGYSSIQSHTTLEKNYLVDGFWAREKTDELACSGISVSFIISMEDVTAKILDGVTEKMTEAQRDEIIKKNSTIIETETVKDTHYKAKVKAFYYGNEYYLFVYEMFTDIRLVGAPPTSIGNFGGDSDNWMWPRHTGDFSIFRIYADSSNHPADYSKNNIPYIPKKSLTISLKGVQKNDFTMVYGFPGKTQEYLTSYGVNLISNVENPVLIGIRDKKLEVIGAAMKSDPLIKIQYASKYANVANYWKKFKGESKGITKLNGVERKKTLETEFTNWVNADASRKVKYGTLLYTFEDAYKNYTPVALAYDYFVEAGVGMELVKYAWNYNNLITKSIDKTVKDDDVNKIVEKLKNGSKYFFKNYNLETDKKLFTALLQIYYLQGTPAYQPEYFSNVISNKFNGDIEKYSTYVYGKTSFSYEAGVQKMLTKFKRNKTKVISDDPVFKLSSVLYNNFIDNILPLYTTYNDELDSLYRIYITALREMQPGKKFYPDANSTLRIGYGKVSDYKPMDAVEYNFYTTLEGIMQKEDEDVSDYKVPDDLKKLYVNKDYGRYSTDSTMHIAFIATNHTTGGNSGSPVLNAEGQLIGINFDRVWEGTMSDIMYDAGQCRNISLDIRYTLFIIDKYAGATWLIDEMKIDEK